MTALRVIYNATYELDPPASAMALRFRLRPLPRPGQIERGVRIATYPDCEDRRVETNDYGVLVDTGSIARPVRRLQVNADLTVAPSPAATMPEIAPRSEDLASEDDQPSRRRDISCSAGLDIIHGLSSGWIYDARVQPSTRSLATLALERRGGCEDIARLAAAALRRRGVPVRFVVGYLGSVDTTVARPRRRHAWLAFWSCDSGWSEIDPLSLDHVIDSRSLEHCSREKPVPTFSRNTLGAKTPLVATAWGPALAELQPVSGTFATGRAKRVSVEIQIIPSAD